MTITRLDHTYTNEDVMFDQENGRILRVIDRRNDFLLDSSVRCALVANGLVEYEIIHVEGKKYASVKPFPFPNDVANWSLHMFLDYCELYRSLARSLKELGLSLIDGHPWNTVFYFTQPKFVDLGSLVAHRASGSAEFGKYARLYWSFRFSAAARSRSFLESQVGTPRYMDVLQDVATRDQFTGYKSKLKRTLGVPAVSPWSHYYGSRTGEYRDVPKEGVLKAVLLSLRPKTVYDIGCNVGHYSLICESYGCDVVGCDPDPICIDNFYLNIKQRSSTVLPLVADMSSFTRALERTYPLLRPKSVDLALVLALVHHLVYREGLSFDSIFQAIRRLGARSVLIELVNKKDENVSKWDRMDKKDWYTVENFIQAGMKFYTKSELFSSHDPTRPVVLFTT